MENKLSVIVLNKELKFIMDDINSSDHYYAKFGELGSEKCPDVVILNFRKYIRPIRKWMKLTYTLKSLKVTHNEKPFVIAYMKKWSKKNHTKAMYCGVDFTFSQHQLDYAKDKISSFLETMYPNLKSL